MAKAPSHARSVLPFGRKPVRTFALAIGLPAFLLYVATASLVMVVLGMMANEIDRLEDARGVASVHAVLGSFLNGLSDSVSDEAAWDEAYLNVVVSSDPAWMDGTWGTTARLGTSYDSVIVTDQAGVIVFGENNSGELKGNIVDHIPAARTMLTELDAGIGAIGDATAITHFAEDTFGPLGLAATSIHRTSSGELPVPRHMRRVLWLARHVTPALLQDFAVRYQAPLATLVAEYDPDVSSIDLTDADGNAVGTVAWTPERPGEKALTHALLIASGAFVAIGLLLVLGLGLLRRVMQHRAKAVAEAFEALQQELTQIAPAPGLAAVPAAEDRLSQEADRTLVGVTAASFDIEYQPIFDLRSEALIGVEGLLRWTNPDGTLLLEESLTPTQRALLLDRIGTLAIRRATEEVATLPGLMLTMAISPAQLQNPVFAEKVSATMRATNFPARRLQLCVDTALLPLIEAARGPIEDLRRAGVLLSLGDCAIAAGPLDYFEANLVDRVKLSSSLLSEGSAARQAYVAASVDAARAAGIVATVTGVEDRAVVARLLRLGCREFQGDLFAAPMGIAALSQLVLAPAHPAEARQAG